MTQFHDLTLVDTCPEGRDGVCLSFAVPDSLRDDFAFTPGQYLTLRSKIGGEDIRRPYSICSVPGGTVLQVGVKRVEDGRMSNFLNDLDAGGTVQVMPPDGRFLAPVGGAVTYLLIAAGSGITPMLSIAEAALAGAPFAAESFEAAAKALTKDFEPLSDWRATAAYRMLAAQNLLRRFWLEQGVGAPVRLSRLAGGVG